jgi:Uma2 family endonuclease
VLRDIDWPTYSKLLRILAQRPSVRLTYDRGSLEIMSPTHRHESCAYLLGRFVDVLSEELGLPIKAGRSTTFRRKSRQRGLEPDNSYWIANEAKVRGKERINLRVDPPPDLAIEVDESHSSLDRMGIYAALRVPEVWRLAAGELFFHILDEAGKYRIQYRSLAFSLLAPADLLQFLSLRATLDENAVVRQFREWVRGRIQELRAHLPTSED